MTTSFFILLGYAFVNQLIGYLIGKSSKNR
jgi:hypothetical protein